MHYKHCNINLLSIHEILEIEHDFNHVNKTLVTFLMAP